MILKNFQKEPSEQRTIFDLVFISHPQHQKKKQGSKMKSSSTKFALNMNECEWI
jgi:hypothetical protein